MGFVVLGLLVIGGSMALAAVLLIALMVRGRRR
jgi:hypothetical protein